jgi:hypothetical protein
MQYKIHFKGLKSFVLSFSARGFCKAKGVYKNISNRPFLCCQEKNEKENEIEMKAAAGCNAIVKDRATYNNQQT